MNGRLRRMRVTVVIREHNVCGSSGSAVAQAGRTTPDVDGLERALREVLGQLRHGVARSPAVRMTILLGCHAVRLRRLEGIPLTLTRGALDDFFREGLARLLAVRPDEVVCTFAREENAHLVAAYDRQTLSTLYEVATRLNVAVAMIVPELVALAAMQDNGFVETRDGRWLGRLDVADGAITSTSLRRVATTTSPEVADSPRVLHGVIAATLAHRRRLAALAAPPPLRPPVQVSRRRARAAVTAAASVALLVAAAGPLDALIEHARARREVATLLSAHAGVLERQQELLAMRETITQASQLAVARPSVVRTLAALTQALPDEMSVLHLELDSLGGTVVIVAPRAGEALARFDRVPGIANPAFRGPITRETGFGPPRDRATIAFRLSDSDGAP